MKFSKSIEIPMECLIAYRFWENLTRAPTSWKFSLVYLFHPISMFFSTVQSNGPPCVFLFVWCLHFYQNHLFLIPPFLQSCNSNGHLKWSTTIILFPFQKKVNLVIGCDRSLHTLSRFVFFSDRQGTPSVPKKNLI